MRKFVKIAPVVLASAALLTACSGGAAPAKSGDEVLQMTREYYNRADLVGHCGSFAELKGGASVTCEDVHPKSDPSDVQSVKVTYVGNGDFDFE